MLGKEGVEECYRQKPEVKEGEGLLSSQPGPSLMLFLHTPVARHLGSKTIWLQGQCFQPPLHVPFLSLDTVVSRCDAWNCHCLGTVVGVWVGSLRAELIH